MKPVYPLILWTDTPADAKPLRDAQTVKTVIRDSLMWDGDPEPAEAIAFWGASRRADIIAAYAAIGTTEVHDIPFNIDEPEYLEEPIILPAPEPVIEPTGIDAQIEAMSEDELRTNITALTGEKPHHAAKRETLAAKLKTAMS